MLLGYLFAICCLFPGQALTIEAWNLPRPAVSSAPRSCRKHALLQEQLLRERQFEGIDRRGLLPVRCR
jgi:hypothetical protein